MTGGELILVLICLAFAIGISYLVARMIHRAIHDPFWRDAGDITFMIIFSFCILGLSLIVWGIIFDIDMASFLEDEI